MEQGENQGEFKRLNCSEKYYSSGSPVRWFRLVASLDGERAQLGEKGNCIWPFLWVEQDALFVFFCCRLIIGANGRS
jgi:hypothetical protein